MALSSTFWRLNLLPKPSLSHFQTSLKFPKPFFKPKPISSSMSSKPRTPYPPDGFVVLGIETSCDDTAAPVVKSNGEILSQVISSQVVQQVLDKANLTERDLSAVAVTIGPVGVWKARKIAGTFDTIDLLGSYRMLLRENQMSEETGLSIGLQKLKLGCVSVSGIILQFLLLR